MKRGVNVRVKNTGGQKRKKGRKRPTDRSPWKEHPATAQNLPQAAIHANHREAFLSALRRKLSSFRRRTNTSAKSQKGLRRVLRMYWVIDHCVRKHFTTNVVPAIQRGVLEREMTVEELCLIQLG